MDGNRNYLLSIAGFDPSGGAGILADIKTFEWHKLNGIAAISALTFQNDKEFESVQWIESKNIIKQIRILQKRFEFNVIKIGLIQNLESLNEIIQYLTATIPYPVILWDPILKASTGFEFHSTFPNELLNSILEEIFVICPNSDEIKIISNNNDPLEAARKLSEYCNVLLKGGHNESEPGTDYLFYNNSVEKILPGNETVYPKHGSGCVLSSSIASNLAMGNNLSQACNNAKKYIEKFLSSNHSLIGSHYV